MKKVPFVFMRGGTSKALFFHKKDMPPRENWDAFFLDAMGSPDINQIDGMGGANSLTSKVAVIEPVAGKPYAVDYTFGQVSIADAGVHYKGNCGNISSAVAPFAVDEGLVPLPASGDTVSVRFRNTNTDKILESVVKFRNGEFDPDGDSFIPGVPNPGSAHRMYFINPEGAVTGKRLPTGNAVDRIQTSRGEVRLSIVDAANPLVYVIAPEIGYTAAEPPDGYTQADLDYFEEIRSAAAELCDFAPKEKATALSPGVPKMTLVAPPREYVSLAGKAIAAGEADICARMMSMQKPHRAMALTGAVCTAVAALTPGTLVAEIVAKPFGDTLRIGHPGGVMEVPVGYDGDGTIKAGALRTSRRLAKGFVYTRKDHFQTAR